MAGGLATVFSNSAGMKTNPFRHNRKVSAKSPSSTSFCLPTSLIVCPSLAFLGVQRAVDGREVDNMGVANGSPNERKLSNN